ncbi:MAG: DUF2190 family protein [Candidatus Pacearchaeota archaeon]
MFKSVLTDTVIAADNIPPKRFVGLDGTVGTGKEYGVTLYGGDKDRPMDVIVIGIAEVEVANGQSVVPGDLVKANASGQAVKDNNNGKYVVKTGAVGGGFAEILIR